MISEGFSQPIFQGNVWESVWRICMLINRRILAVRMAPLFTQ